jgi:catechol 2,3-dioxygenase-like lactoylglutathione lyase family enzyme
MQPSRIHHVGLPVSDLDLSVAWYREALGLTHEAAAGVPGVLPSWLRRPASGSNCSRSTPKTPLGTIQILALRAGVGHTAWTVDDLDAAHARAVEAGGRSVWTPRDTPEPGLRIAFVADPDGNLVELLSRDGEAPPT